MSLLCMASVIPVRWKLAPHLCMLGSKLSFPLINTWFKGLVGANLGVLELYLLTGRDAALRP